MEKIVFSLLLFSSGILLSVTSSLAQSGPLPPGFDTLTVAEAQQLLEEEQNSIETLLRISELRLQIVASSATDQPDTSPSFEASRYTLLSNDSVEARIDRYLKATKFVQELSYPTNRVRLYHDSFHEAFRTVAERWGAYADSVTYRVDSLFGATALPADAAVMIEPSDSLPADILVQPAVYLDSVRLTATYSYPTNIQQVALATTDAVVYLFGDTIRLQHITGSEVAFALPQSLNDQLIHAEAIHASGQALEERGSSYSSLPSAETIAYLRSVADVFEDVLAQVRQQKIKEQNDLIDLLEKQLPTAPAQLRQTIIRRQRYGGPVEYLNLFFHSGDTKTVSKTVTIRLPAYTATPHPGYYLATDPTTERDGFVNEQGEWVIAPEFQHLENLNGFFYRGEYKGNLNQKYWLNTRANRLERVAYELDEIEVYHGNLVNIEQEVNGAEGVFNAETGEMIIPMKYDYINVRHGLFATILNHQQGVYDRQGKALLPEVYTHIRVDSGFIYTKIDVEGAYDDDEDVFDFAGNNLTGGAWHIEGTFSKDGLLLVTHKEASERAYSYSYLNEQGQVMIDATAYREANSFSNGLAAVRNQAGLWGYIDGQGRIAIPFAYKSASFFQEKHAYVEQGDVAYLINRKGQVVKKFDKTAVWRKVGQDRDDAVYQIGAEKYDAYGNLIE